MKEKPAPQLPTEIYYQWKELVSDGNIVRLLNVQSDPHEYELSVGDLLFGTQEEAMQILESYDCREEAIQDHWILVKTTFEPVLSLGKNKQ